MSLQFVFVSKEVANLDEAFFARFGEPLLIFGSSGFTHHTSSDPLARRTVKSGASAKRALRQRGVATVEVPRWIDRHRAPCTDHLSRFDANGTEPRFPGLDRRFSPPFDQDRILRAAQGSLRYP